MASNGKPKINHPSTESEDANSLEANVVRLAMQGKLAGAARRAIREQVKKGLPVTFKRGTKLIKRFPDGREEVLGEVPRPKYRIPAGVRIIGGQ